MLPSIWASSGFRGRMLKGHSTQGEEGHQRGETRTRRDSNGNPSGSRVRRCPHPPTSTNIPDCQTTIQFNLDKSTIFPIMALKDYSREEHHNCFYNQMDFNLMLKRAKKILRKMETGELDKRTCARGLDKRHGKRQVICQHIRSKTINTVLDMQQDQWDMGKDNDGDPLAKSCRQITQEASRRAVREARQDVKAAQNYLRDVDKSNWANASPAPTAVNSILKVRHPSVGLPVARPLFPERGRVKVTPSCSKQQLLDHTNNSVQKLPSTSDQTSHLADHLGGLSVTDDRQGDSTVAQPRIMSSDFHFHSAQSLAPTKSGEESRTESKESGRQEIAPSSSLATPIIPTSGLDSQMLIPPSHGHGGAVITQKKPGELELESGVSKQIRVGMPMCKAKSLATNQNSSMPFFSQTTSEVTGRSNPDGVHEPIPPSSSDASSHVDDSGENHCSTHSSETECILPRADGQDTIKSSKKINKNSVSLYLTSGTVSKPGIVAGQRISRFARGTIIPSSRELFPSSPSASPQSVVVRKRIKKPKPGLSQSDHGHCTGKNRNSRKAGVVALASGEVEQSNDMLPRKSFSSHC